MREPYRQSKSIMIFDWVPVVGVVGALGLLLASFASYFTSHWHAQEQAELQSYLSTGINPTR
jgi:hypothetical protein